MKLAFTIAAAAAAVAFTSLSNPTPAAAYCNGTSTQSFALFAVPVCPPTNTHKGGSSAGPYVIGCIAGSAVGLMVSALVKGRATNSELTIPEAQLIGFTCGLGAFPVIGSYTN
jgi:hypothetical protein